MFFGIPGGQIWPRKKKSPVPQSPSKRGPRIERKMGRQEKERHLTPFQGSLSPTSFAVAAVVAAVAIAAAVCCVLFAVAVIRTRRRGSAEMIPRLVNYVLQRGEELRQFYLSEEVVRHFSFVLSPRQLAKKRKEIRQCGLSSLPAAKEGDAVEAPRKNHTSCTVNVPRLRDEFFVSLSDAFVTELFLEKTAYLVAHKKKP